MKLHLALISVLTTLWLSVTHRLRPAQHEDADRGDVPGWVMITMMYT